MSTAVRLLRGCPALLVLLLLSAAGCTRIHIPKAAAGSHARMHDLSEHVEFFTQPALKGRKCRSLESWYVRQYIRQQFEAYGLTPRTKSGFDESFGFGTNVVGVLRGSDATLANEVVLVCAHYDGLGVKNDKVYPGAADSAAGMAILLQTAEQLSRHRGHLRRSVVFAALDCGQERYLGAFALTLRKDFSPAPLAAVIDLDLLGRDNFDIVENTLIVTGTQTYPEIRQIITQAANHPAGRPASRNTATGQAASQPTTTPGPLRIMYSGSDLLPPMSGYFAFEQWPIPVLLFTNGLYIDYDKPTDTPDKLHYNLLRRDADVVAQTVRELASRPKKPTWVEPIRGDREELQGILMTLEQVLAHAEPLQLTPPEIRTFTHLASRAQALLDRDEYTLADRKTYILEMVERGAPSILRFFYSAPKPDPARLVSPQQMAALLAWYEFFASHRPFASYAMQQVIRHFLDARGNLIRLLSTYTFLACDIVPDEIVYAKQNDERYRLSWVHPQLKIQAGISARDLNVNYAAVDCRGTTDQVIDYSLLYWAAGDEECLSRVMPTVLERVHGENEGAHYRDWLAWRLGQIGAANEGQWLAGLWRTDVPDLLKILLQLAKTKAGSDKQYAIPPGTLERIIPDTRMRPDVRADAIEALPAGTGKEVLLTLVDLLQDATLIHKGDYLPAFDATFPFYGHPGMREMRSKPLLPAHGTVGMAAYMKLKALSGQDFHGDGAAWRAWASANR